MYFCIYLSNIQIESKRERERERGHKCQTKENKNNQNYNKNKKKVYKNKIFYCLNKTKKLNAYLVTIPVQSVSIFLKSREEKKEGSLHISFVINLNSA